MKIANSTNEPSTTDNDINIFKGQFDVVVDNNLSSTTAWFLQGERHGLLSAHGETPQLFDYTEDSTQSKVKAIGFDFVVGPEYPDGMAGTSGA
jgi:hypothetical protein